MYTLNISNYCIINMSNITTIPAIPKSTLSGAQYAQNKLRVIDIKDFKDWGAIFSADLVEPIKNLLTRFPIKITDSLIENVCELNPGCKAYFIRDGVIYITKNLPSFVHELAHIICIKNLNKLLIDDFGMPLLDHTHSASTAERWMICSEARVWGVESFLRGNKRSVNVSWLEFVQSDVKEKAQQVLDRYYKSMTNELVLSSLEGRFNYIMCHIKENNLFDSKYFCIMNNSYDFPKKYLDALEGNKKAA